MDIWGETAPRTVRTETFTGICEIDLQIIDNCSLSTINFQLSTINPPCLQPSP
ncbi:hypothetical protein NIES39_C04010 [Arthrospira platensis NIES-39]|nr:hypothetical protein NIES39_C04010 [Arthrospira platensis NIES-39]